MVNEFQDKPEIVEFPRTVFVQLPVPEVVDVGTPFYQGVIQKQQAALTELESENFWLSQKAELKFFTSRTEFFQWKRQYNLYDMEKRILKTNQQFFDKSVPANLRCVACAYGLTLLAADDGYVLGIGQINNYTHWVNEVVLGRMLWGIDPANGYTAYSTSVAE